MTNNDILKKLRVALQLRNNDIVHILSLVDFKVTESELTAFFRSEDHDKYRPLGDQILRNFLNGLVIHLRGHKDAPTERSTPDPSKEIIIPKDKVRTREPRPRKVVEPKKSDFPGKVTPRSASFRDKLNKAAKDRPKPDSDS